MIGPTDPCHPTAAPHLNTLQLLSEAANFHHHAHLYSKCRMRIIKGSFNLQAGETWQPLNRTVLFWVSGNTGYDSTIMLLYSLKARCSPGILLKGLRKTIKPCVRIANDPAAIRSNYIPIQFGRVSTWASLPCFTLHTLLIWLNRNVFYAASSTRG